jgi:thiaminase/transcriptional activator TenA
VTFTAELWDEIRTIRESVDEHPFLRALEDGTLSRERFDYYLGQDALYLGVYARVLAAAATQSVEAHDLVFWSERASSAIAVERLLHESFVGDSSGRDASPTCTAYTSYLLSLVAGGCQPALVAGLLPCFWIYEDVGRRLKSRLGDLDGHPFARWIETYDDPAFAEATGRARAIVDEAARSSGADVRDQMRRAFVTASRYEWMFWDAAWRMERWPV